MTTIIDIGQHKLHTDEKLVILTLTEYDTMLAELSGRHMELAVRKAQYQAMKVRFDNLRSEESSTFKAWQQEFKSNEKLESEVGRLTDIIERVRMTATKNDMLDIIDGG